MQKLQDQSPTIRQATEVSVFNMTKVNTGIRVPHCILITWKKEKKNL